MKKTDRAGLVLGLDESMGQSTRTQTGIVKSVVRGFTGQGLKARALRGSLWTVGGYGFQQVLRLGSSLVLTRLLTPTAYGLMSIVWMVLAGLQMFSDLGLAPAIIRDKRGEEDAYVNTAWTIQVVRGFVLALLSAALAWPLAAVYGEPMLRSLIPVTGLTAIISGFQSTKVSQATRNMDLRRLTIQQLSGSGCSIFMTVAIACIWPSVWSIVLGSLVGSTLGTVLSHTLLHGTRNRFDFERAAARELVRFGKWIFFSSAVYFLSQQVDRAMLGGLISMNDLGIYSIAFMLTQVPITLNKELSRNVGYPALGSVFRERVGEFRTLYYRLRTRLNLLFLPALGILMGGGGRLLVGALYDTRYAPAGWICELMCIRAAMRCMLEPKEAALVAWGYPVYAVLQHVLRLAWMVVLLPLWWHYWGFFGAVLATATSEIPVLAVLWFGARRLGFLDVKEELQGLGMVLGGYAVARIVLGTVLSSARG